MNTDKKFMLRVWADRCLICGKRLTLNKALSPNLLLYRVLGFLGMLVVCAPLSAELPQARLMNIAPAGVTRGAMAEVTVTGEDLEELKGLYFSSPRISAKPKMGANGAAVAGKFVVTVDAETTPGLYDVRAIGRYGISNPRTLQVGIEPAIDTKPGNISVQKALDLPEWFSVSATAEANAAHFYRLAAKKGQRIFVAASTACLESRMEANLLLTDGAGREVASSRDGESLDYVATMDGPFVLKVHDVLYRGGADYFYHLTSTGLPAAEVMAPADFSVFRWPVPAAAALLDRASCRASTGKSTERFLYLPQSRVFGQESTGLKAESVQLLDPPCTVAGRFQGSEPSAWFGFNASVGTVYWIEAFSHRLGESASPMMLVQRIDKNEKGDAKATDIAEVYETAAAGAMEFPAGSRDPVFRFECKQAGMHRLMLRNLFGSSSEKGAAYCLEIRKESPDFHLVALPASPLADPKDSKDIPLSTTFLRRGGVTPIRVAVQRRDGFAGGIRLQVKGLPAGVSAVAGNIAAGDSVGTLLLSASGDAAEAVAPISISGVASIGGVEVSREARAAVVSWSAYDKANKRIDVLRSRVCAEFMIAVSGVEECPISIAAATDQVWEMKEGAKLAIPFKIVRRAEVSSAISMKLAGHSVLGASKEISVDAKADAGSIELDLAQNKLPAGEYTLYIEAQAKVKYTKKTGDKPQVLDVTGSFFSTPFRVKVVAVPKAAK
jgi:hypothetical protein